MRARARHLPAVLLACVVVATIAAAALAGSPRASAQSSPGGSTGATGATCPSSVAPNELVLVGGTPQTAQLEAAFGSGLQVELANTDGCAVTTTLVGIPVTFTAPASGASATFGASGSDTLAVGTDTTGSASAQTLTANDTAGTYTVTASCAYGSVSFALTNSAAGIAATITPETPTSQRATVDSRYADPLRARVLDANGDPVVGATVTFALAGTGTGSGTGGGSSSAGATFDGGGTQATETTGGDGVATSPGFAANATSGHFTATATTARVVEPAQFALENLGKGPETLTALGPSRRQATVDTSYGRRLRVRVRDRDGSAVADATVTFSLAAASAAAGTTGGGAGATFTGGSTTATATTGAKGIATSPRLGANAVAGSFTATVTVTGAHALALYHLYNHASKPALITAGVGATQTATTRARFAIRLAVTVTDTHDNRVPAARVTFTAPTDGASGTFPDGRTRIAVETNSSGVAVAPPFTANGAQGGYVVMATTGHARAAAFALVNTTP